MRQSTMPRRGSFAKGLADSLERDLAINTIKVARMESRNVNDAEFTLLGSVERTQRDSMS